MIDSASEAGHQIRVFVSSLSPLLYRREPERSRLNPEMLSTILRTPFGGTKNRLYAGCTPHHVSRPSSLLFVPIRATFYNPPFSLPLSISPWKNAESNLSRLRCHFHRARYIKNITLSYQRLATWISFLIKSIHSRDGRFHWKYRWIEFWIQRTMNDEIKFGNKVFWIIILIMSTWIIFFFNIS